MVGVGAGGGDAPCGARHGSLFLVPIHSSLCVSDSCGIVTVAWQWSALRPLALACSLMGTLGWPRRLCAGGVCATQAGEFKDRSLFPEP
jgi:hypothetical protein